MSALAKPSYLVSFSCRVHHAATEQICVVYVPTYPPNDLKARLLAFDTAIQTIMLLTGVRPRVIPLECSLLEKSSLGKLSRSKIRASFESGAYSVYEETNNDAVKEFRASQRVLPETDVERMLLQEFSMALNVPIQGLGMEDHVFELGVTSIELIKLARRLEERLGLPFQIPILTMMTHPTVRSLTMALEDLKHPTSNYDPVVVLQHSGSKTPLWLVHPGVGEVLVFLHLAKYIQDSPVFALRARGFEVGESCFENISEAVETYHAAIRKRQPTGPYAIAGYSYGAMLAFELAKSFESNGEEVPFLGCFNLPPHIQMRMQQLGWTECLANLAYFLDLISEQRAHDLISVLRTMEQAQAINHLLAVAAPARIADLSLTHEGLQKWVGLAHRLQSMAREYEPTGEVGAIDVFYCIPLKVVAATKEEWLEHHLSGWAHFCRTEPRFHDVAGSHYTMIGKEHVFSFQQQLRKAIKARGL